MNTDKLGFTWQNNGNIILTYISQLMQFRCAPLTIHNQPSPRHTVHSQTEMILLLVMVYPQLFFSSFPQMNPNAQTMEY